MSRNPTTKERTVLAFEPLGLAEVVMVGRYYYRQAHLPLLAHTHPDVFEIVVLARGQQTYEVAGRSHRLQSGDVLVTPPGAIHGTGGEAEGKGRLYWMELRDLRPGSSLLGLPPKESQLVLRQLRRLPTRPFPGGVTLLAILERIISTYRDGRGPLRRANLQNLLLRFMLDLLELAKAHPDAPHGAAVPRALQLIEANLGSPISVEFLAQSVHMSPSHFKACFKREVGLPPAEYLTRRRLDEARHLLSDSTVRVTEIAHALGFESSQHFATVFRRFTGQTPLSYRRRHQQPVATPPPVVAGTGPRFHPIAQPD